MSCLRLHSRASVPTAPRKYLVVTIVEALTDQKSGNSTPRCSKTVSPVFQLVWTTSRRSQVISSYGCTPSVLKILSIFRPAPVLAAAPPLTVSVMCAISLSLDDFALLMMVSPTTDIWVRQRGAAGETSGGRCWFARRAQLPHYTRRAVWVS